MDRLANGSGFCVGANIGPLLQHPVWRMFPQEVCGIVEYFVRNETDFQQGARHDRKRISWLYDWDELAVCTIVLASCALLALSAHGQSI